MRSLILAAIAAVALGGTASKPDTADARCQTKACVERVAKKRLVREMRHYKKNPLPWCTWGPESGAHRPQWSWDRYRQPNVSGGTGGGKFQIIDSTWINFGGLRYANHAYNARPVYQERVARRIARTGLQHWVNC